MHVCICRRFGTRDFRVKGWAKVAIELVCCCWFIKLHSMMGSSWQREQCNWESRRTSRYVRKVVSSDLAPDTQGQWGSETSSSTGPLNTPWLLQHLPVIRKDNRGLDTNPNCEDLQQVLDHATDQTITHFHLKCIVVGDMCVLGSPHHLD